MKWLFALLLSLPLMAQADPVAAAQDYAAGRFEAALQQYEAALRDGRFAAGPLLYDLGNCAYRLGDHAAAALYFRRALLQLPDCAAARFNLTLAQEQLGVREPVPGPRGVMAWLDGWSALLTVSLLQTAGLFGLLLLRRTSLRGVSLLLLLFGLLGGAQQLSRRLGATPPEAVVLTPSPPLRQQPGADATVLASLAAGEVVRVLGRSADWLHVENASGSGWVERTAVGLVQ